MKKISGNILTLIISICIILLLAEGISRIVLEKPQTVLIENLDQPVITKGTEEPTFDFLYLHTPTGNRLKKNMKVRIKNHYLSKKDVIITTNSLGYRYDELKEKTENDVRILVLGDSITLGDYVDNNKTYPTAIEENLQNGTEKNIQVINAGVGSIDLQNELAILMESGLSTNPDIVLVGLYLNDAIHSLSLNITKLPPLLKKSYFLNFIMNKVGPIKEKFRFAQTQQAIPLIQERENTFKNMTIANEDWKTSEKGFNLLIYRNFGDWGYAWSEKYIDNIAPTLRLMKELSKENDFELVVVFLPVKYQVQAELEKNEPQQNVKKLMEELEIRYLDVLPSLKQKYQKDQANLFYDQCHYMPKGNKFIGDQIAEFLKNEFPTLLESLPQ